MRILVAISLCLLSVACRDNLKIKTYGKPVSATIPPVIPEVSSSVEILTDESGVLRPNSVAGATKYGVRILDASCDKEVADLGIQDKPEFSLPSNSYGKALCMETTYYSAEGKMLEVKIQPFSFQGPEATEMVLSKDKQILDFPDVPGAVNYQYILTDARGQLVAAESGLVESLIDFLGSLLIGNYKLTILGQDSQGKTLKIINYKLKVKANPTNDPLSLNLKFEREYYQTRSIKRVIFEEGLVVEGIGLRINNQDLESTLVTPYKSGFAALLSAQDAMMRDVLSYGQSTAKVTIVGVSTNTYELGVTVKDFPLFQVLPAAFGDIYAKGGLEAWTSIVDTPLVKSGEHTLTNDFGLMILQ